MCGKILEGEHFGESSLMKRMVWKILANLLGGLQLLHYTYIHRIGKENFWQIEHHSSNSPKFPTSDFPSTVYTYVCIKSEDISQEYRLYIS